MGHSLTYIISEKDKAKQAFYAILPSEAHRRRSRVSESNKESRGLFSGRAYSFTHFTNELVHQYHQKGELYSNHQAALLCLLKQAQADQTRAQLAWRTLQKRVLRDKREDDKMPSAKKSKPGLFL